MPKRTPGGRVRKTTREKRRAAPVAAPPAEAAAGPALTARERAEATHPVRAQTAAPVARPSLLAGVRRQARPNAPNLAVDYTYVMSDLRRIGILAGAAFLILIALTFVIR